MQSSNLAVRVFLSSLAVYICLLETTATVSAQALGEDTTSGITMLTLAKTHDQSCDVLDSKAQADFRRAVSAWIGSLKEEQATKSLIWKDWEATGAKATHDCAGMAMMAVPLWTFRDPRGEDPQAQFRFLTKAKSYELKCHVLSRAALQAFYETGLQWIGKTGASEPQRAAMTAEWQKADGSEEADCEKDSLLNFMVTWTFRAKSGS
jgi:hypothetical protein